MREKGQTGTSTVDEWVDATVTHRMGLSSRFSTVRLASADMSRGSDDTTLLLKSNSLQGTQSQRRNDTWDESPRHTR